MEMNAKAYPVLTTGRVGKKSEDTNATVQLALMGRTVKKT